MSKLKLGKKGILFLFLFVAIIGIGSGYLVIRDKDSTERNEIPLDFDDRWIVTNPRGESGIFDEGDYIKIYNNEWNYPQVARLSFEPISEGYFRFKIKSPDLTKIGAFCVDLKAGDNVLFEIGRDDVLTFASSDIDYGIVILEAMDVEWHTIEIEFVLNGDESVVTVTLDGNIVVDNLMFSTFITSIDTLWFSGGRYWCIPNLTHIKLEKLISK